MNAGSTTQIQELVVLCGEDMAVGNDESLGGAAAVVVYVEHQRGECSQGSTLHTPIEGSVTAAPCGVLTSSRLTSASESARSRRQSEGLSKVAQHPYVGYVARRQCQHRRGMYKGESTTTL